MTAPAVDLKEINTSACMAAAMVQAAILLAKDRGDLESLARHVSLEHLVCHMERVVELTGGWLPVLLDQVD